MLPNCITQSGLAEVLDWSSGKISKELNGLVTEGRIFVAQEAVNRPKLYYRLLSIEA